MEDILDDDILEGDEGDNADAENETTKLADTRLNH